MESENKTWPETLFDFAENAFGLVADIGLTIFQKVIRYIKRVLTLTGIGIACGALLGTLGALFDLGALVFVGIALVGTSITFAFLALSPAVLLLWAGQEKNGKIKRLTATAFVLMASFLVLGTYVVAFRAWHNPEFWILMVAVAILIMATVMRGTSINPEVIGGWAKRVSIIVIVYIAASWGANRIPEFYRSNITDYAENLVGLNSGEVPYESIKKFYSNAGKPIIWYTEEKNGQRLFFGSPGYDQRLGHARKPITEGVIEQEDAKRVQKKKADSVPPPPPPIPVFIRDISRPKPEEKPKAVEVPKPEVQRPVQPSNEEVAQQQQADRERAARDQAIYDQRQLASRTVSVTSTVLAPAKDQLRDTVVVRPDAPFRYGDKVIQPARSVMILGITEVRPVSTSEDEYELILQPKILMANGQKYDIAHQSALLSLTVKKDNSHSRAKIIGGAIGGAILGALAGGKKGAAEGLVIGAVASTVYAMASHGKKFQLIVGGPVPPIFIKP